MNFQSNGKKNFDNLLKLVTITSLLVMGVYFLTHTVLLWFYISNVEVYPFYLLYPVIVFPIISGGHLLSVYGIIRRNKGVKPFGTIFVILGFLHLLPLFNIRALIYYFTKLLYQDHIIVTVLIIHSRAAQSFLVSLVFTIIGIFQVTYFRRFEGQVISIDKYLAS